MGSYAYQPASLMSTIKDEKRQTWNTDRERTIYQLAQDNNDNTTINIIAFTINISNRS